MANFYQPKKRPQLTNKHQQVRIDRLDHQGAGIAFLQNKPIFIEGALPNEEVVIQLTEQKSNHAKAKLIKVIKPCEERITPFCPHYEECGGCNMQHLSYEVQLKYKQAALSQLIRKFSGASLVLSDPIKGQERAYRRRARFSLLANKKTGKLEFGFRKKQSKQIVQITDCGALEPKLNALLVPLYTLLSRFNLASLGHLELALGDDKPVVMLRSIKKLLDSERQALQDFALANHLSVYLFDQDNQLEHLVGEQPFYSEAGFTIPFLPTNFIQVNRKVNQQMVAQALEWLDITQEDRVLDLFCGLGNFTLPMATKAKSVVGVEGIQTMVDQASQNAKNNRLDNVSFFQANLEDEIANNHWAKMKFDKILLDPARAGASGVVDQLSELGATRIVYVSCNPATLARDCQNLLNQGYHLTRLGMLDMFPHTSHLESMALFEK